MVGLENFLLIAKNVVKNKQIYRCLKACFGYILHKSRSFSVAYFYTFRLLLLIALSNFRKNRFLKKSPLKKQKH